MVELPKGLTLLRDTGVVTDLRSLIPNEIMREKTQYFGSTKKFVEIILIFYTLFGIFIIFYALKELVIFISEKLSKSQAKRSISE